MYSLEEKQFETFQNTSSQDNEYDIVERCRPAGLKVPGPHRTAALTAEKWKTGREVNLCIVCTKISKPNQKIMIESKW